MVEVFNRSIAAYPNGSTVLTSEGEVGVVVRQNKEMPTRPILRMISNKQGEKYQGVVEKDLVKELSLFIKDTID